MKKTREDQILETAAVLLVGFGLMYVLGSIALILYLNLKGIL